MSNTIDSRSETGMTIGLIDSINTLTHFLANRLDMNDGAVVEALKDLRESPKFEALLFTMNNLPE